MITEAQVIALVAKQVEDQSRIIQPTDRLEFDLGFDSLDLVEVVINCEAEFNIEIPDAGPINDVVTVADLVAVVQQAAQEPLA